MITIVGLGNPGEKFKNTRHNLGFMTVDFFAKKNNFPVFQLSKKYNSLILETNYSNFLCKAGIVKDEEKILLVKPQTFMNESGKVIKQIILNFKFQISNLIVVHDDIDLPIGKIKISKDSGSGGHKGVDSIINALGKKDFIRFRIGICPQNGKPAKIEQFVIKKFTGDEKIIIEESIQESADALSFFIENDLEKTMNQFN